MSNLKGKDVIKITKRRKHSIPIGSKPISIRRLFDIGPFTIWWTKRRPKGRKVSKMRFMERFSVVVSRLAEIKRLTARLAAKVAVERVFPTTKRFVGWSARGVSKAVKSIGSAAWLATETLVTRVLPAAIRLGGQIAGGVFRVPASGVSRSAKSMRSTARLTVQAIVAWFFPLWLLMGLMGNAFFRPHNLFPILLVVLVVTIGAIWLSRRGKRAQ